MALPDLAAVADLNARGIEPDDDDVATVFLKVASALVRQAAGAAISRATSTVSLWSTDDSQWLDLPGQPVASVATVTVDGSAVTDFKLVHGRLWRRCGWGWLWNWQEPTEVVVTMTHGLATVPDDIVQLVCDLAILGLNTADAGALDPRVVTEKIDDYSVTFAQGAGAVASAMSLPEMTKASLRARFGGGLGVVTQR